MRASGWMMGLLVGCGAAPSGPDDEVDGRSERASVPIYGGGLASEGELVVATAAAHDAVVFVHAPPGDARVLGTTVLPVGSVPNRVEIDRDAVFVVLRGTGEVARLHAGSRQLIGRAHVCDEPRDLDVDGDDLWVTCAGGWIVQLDRDLTERGRWFVERDLRDIVVEGREVWVSLSSTAEVLRLDPLTLGIQLRVRPDLGTLRAARTGTRLRSSEPGVALLHQSATLQTLQLDGPLDELPEDVEEPSAPYGSAGCGDTGATQAHITYVDASGLVTTQSLAGVTLPVDFHEDRVADAGRAGAWTLPSADITSGCPSLVQPPTRGDGPTTAVLWTDAHFVGIQEAPFAIRVDHEPLDLGPDGPGALPTDAAVRTFHLDAGAGIACASCHPEGQQDGHVWHFSSVGGRRTQSIAGDLLQRAPYHWDADMEDLDMLVEEVFVHRMGGGDLDELEVVELAEWMDGLRPVRHAPLGGDPTAGAQVFETAGCEDCHGGPAWTTNQVADVGTGGTFKTPSLLGVGSRGPWMHDGCASTLRGRFSECGGGDAHGHTSDLTPEQITDLVAFLETL